MENMIDLIMERFDRLEAKIDLLLECIEEADQEYDDADIMPFGRERNDIETL